MTGEAIAQMRERWVHVKDLVGREADGVGLGVAIIVAEFEESLDSLEAEIERLTKERDEALDALEVTRGAVVDTMNLEAEIERWRTRYLEQASEVEWLRATMRRIAFDAEGRKRDYLGPDVYDDVEIALAALENKPRVIRGDKPFPDHLVFPDKGSV